MIKASGDTVENEVFIRQCKNIAQQTTNNVVIICGSGKQINTRLLQEGYSVGYDKNGERKICCPEAEGIVRATLKNTRDSLAQNFMDYDNIYVQGSWIEVAGIYCHVNADTFVFTYYLGFDRIYVYTFPGNAEKKQESFANYPKVEIIEL